MSHICCARNGRKLALVMLLLGFNTPTTNNLSQLDQGDLQVLDGKQPLTDIKRYVDWHARLAIILIVNFQAKSVQCIIYLEGFL